MESEADALHMREGPIERLGAGFAARSSHRGRLPDMDPIPVAHPGTAALELTIRLVDHDGPSARALGQV